MQSVNVYGLGYIGLPTAAILANKGYQVLGVDVSLEVIETINEGKVHIVEPELDTLVKRAVSSGRLEAKLTAAKANIHIIAVPTPFKERCKPDLAYIEAATATIASVLQSGDLIILESTSPVGTTDLIAKTLQQACSPLTDFYVAHSPERVIPGRVIQELVENDRVIGGVDEASTVKAVSFYQTFVEGEVMATNARTAEMCKLTENSFRDVNIAFANELSIICDELDINVWELIGLANHHPRVNILRPGPGVGGHCIAVDPWFIVDSAPKSAQIIRLARNINDNKPRWVIDKVKQAAAKFTQPVIACLGAAFKADIDDLRESPSLAIIQHLQQAAIGKIITVEPNVNDIDSVTLVSLDEALEQADILLLLVEHKEFKCLDRAVLLEKTVIDTKGILFND